MGFLSGKRALIVGLASNRSIAWGIAKAMQREGAELAFAYQNEKLRDRVEKMAGECGTEITVPCDVTSDEQIDAVFDHLDNYWDGLDIIVHSVAFAPRTELEGDYLESVSREGFRLAHEISSYSFSALAKSGCRMMEGRDGSLLTLSYYGAEKAMPNYNVMVWPKPAWKPMCAIWPRAWGRTVFASMRSQPVRSERWRRQVSPISVKC